MIKPAQKLFISTAAVAFLLTGYQYVSNADGTTQPGSSNDPIVTKSYVDQQVAELVKKEIAKLDGTKPTVPDKPSTGAGSAAMGLVTVKPGETIVGAEGTEFVIRAGKGIAYTEDGGGLSDLTGGKDIAGGTVLAGNHYIVAPRAKRGITADAKTKVSLVVLVRGDYTIKMADK
ncbi:hypothetical protein [Paenibacillus gansuensis]|uniref:Uncharacterized protein n=1 Tax=Paenibacillus gansuensis TaxID=306542 RepID=A0ABW5PKU3_9BACL